MALPFSFKTLPFFENDGDQMVAGETGDTLPYFLEPGEHLIPGLQQQPLVMQEQE